MIDMAAVPAPEIDPGLKPTVMPEGCPDAVRLMVELNPPLTELVMMELPEAPGASESDAGDALSEKLPEEPVTVSAMVVVETMLPDVPVTVMV